MDAMKTCECCDTVGEYIGKHLDPAGSLQRDDADDAGRIVDEMEYAFQGSIRVTVAELAEYCRGLAE